MKDYIGDSLDERLPPAHVDKAHARFRSSSEKEIVEILHRGSGWGALEKKRRDFLKDGRPMPSGFIFPDETLGDEQEDWLKLLKSSCYPSLENHEIPPSWIVDPEWIPVLEKSMESDPTNPWPLIHLGNIYRESCDMVKAAEYWKASIIRQPTTIAWRNLAVELGEDEAVEAYKTVLSDGKSAPDVHLVKELMYIFLDRKRYNDVWNFLLCIAPGDQKYGKSHSPGSPGRL